MKKTWDQGEIIAIRYLQSHDYQIRDTNFVFWRFWEVDIIAEKWGRYYFFEVKFRKNQKFGLPEESIISSKLRKCLKTVEYYCVKHQVSMENIQFDVITILQQKDSYRVTHYKNIEL